MALLAGAMTAAPAAAAQNPRLSGSTGPQGTPGARGTRQKVPFGSAIGPAVDDDPGYAALVLRTCSIVVPEYEMKWRELSARPGSYDFGAADRRVAFAERHGLLFRGHTLVWHASMPDWFAAVATPHSAAALLEAHISTVAGRYAGRIRSWDVVNEAVAPEDGHPLGLRRTALLELMGEGYIADAFRAAHAADPHARLAYNEYGLAWAGPAGDARRKAVLRLLESLLAAKVPVHLLGIQAHLDTGSTALDVEALEGFCAKVRGLGLGLAVTELDVVDRLPRRSIAESDQATASVYRQLLETVLAAGGVEAVLTWGLSDDESWIARSERGWQGAMLRPLPFDRERRPKPAWSSITRALDL